MNKRSYQSAILVLCIALSSCGIGSTNKTPDDALTSTSAATAAGGLLGNVLSALLGNTTTEESIVGTWTYSAPKVVFESENILSKLGGTVAGNKIENTLDSQLKKVGFTAGSTKMTFNSDKTCMFVIGKKEYSGTYAFDSSSHKMTITGAFGLGTLTCTATVSGDSMYMLFDADGILKIAANLSSTSSKTATLSSLLGNYSGLKMGWTMTK